MSRAPVLVVAALAAAGLLSGCEGDSSYTSASSATAAGSSTGTASSGTASSGTASSGTASSGTASTGTDPAAEAPAGGQPAGEPPAGEAPAGRQPAGKVPAAAKPAPPRSALPAALVGSWSGDDRARIGSWSLTFSADGRYQMSNERRGMRITGQAAADGAKLLFQPAAAQAYSVTWTVSGGRLSLDGDVYLRTDGGGGTPALVGQWMSLKNVYRSVTFSADGRYLITDPVNGDVAGTYTVSGDRVIVAANGGNPSTLGWSVRDGFLRLRLVDGSIAEYTRAG